MTLSGLIEQEAHAAGRVSGRVQHLHETPTDADRRAVVELGRRHRKRVRGVRVHRGLRLLDEIAQDHRVVTVVVRLQHHLERTAAQLVEHGIELVGSAVDDGDLLADGDEVDVVVHRSDRHLRELGRTDGLAPADLSHQLP